MYTSITISIKQKKFSNMEENKRDLVFMADYAWMDSQFSTKASDICYTSSFQTFKFQI